MFQGQGVILESRMQVRLGKMTGIAGLGKEAEIGQLKRSDQCRPLRKRGAVGSDPEEGMDQDKTQEQRIQCGDQ